MADETTDSGAVERHPDMLMCNGVESREDCDNDLHWVPATPDADDASEVACQVCAEGRDEWVQISRGMRDDADDAPSAPATPDADDANECRCPPCPGRGNDGHGLTHCAECCFGTGVEAEPGCPIHHPLPAASTGASEVETLARLLERHGVSSVSGDRERGIAQALLASDWLAARESVAASKALTDAADEWGGAERVRMETVAKWLRNRAARIARGDA